MAEEVDELLVPAELKQSFVGIFPGLVEAQDKVARKVCETDAAQKKFSEDVEAKFQELTDQQEKKYEELKKLLDEQNETLKALVEEKVGAAVSQLQDFAKAQADAVEEKFGPKLGDLEESLQTLRASESETTLKTVPELRAHVKHEVEKLAADAESQRAAVELLESEQKRIGDLAQTGAALKSELDSLRDKLAILDECSLRLQNQNKEILVSLQAAKNASGAGANASETDRIGSFIEHQRARSERLGSLPGARVQLTAPLNKSVSQGGGNPDALRFAVAQAASEYEVHADDVTVLVSEETVECEVCLMGKDASVRAVTAAIVADLELKDRSEIIKVLVGIGAKTDKNSVKVQPKWPLERVQGEIEVEYGYIMSHEQLDEVIGAVATSSEVYGKAWNKAKSKSKQAVESLLHKESMARYKEVEAESQFGDTLLPNSEGQERSLEENWVSQEASRLEDVMEDAAKAQTQLKALMAPGTDWSQAVLNDPKEVPHSDEQRQLKTGPRDPVPCAEMWDPGVKGRDRVLEKAQTRQKPLDVEPPVGGLVDVSRFGLIFDTAEHLKEAMDWMLKNLDVVWLANKFSSPSCLGYRDVNMGVRQLVPANRSTGQKSRVHVTEVQLLLKDLYEIKQGEGHKAYESIRSVLAQCGVKYKDFDKIQQYILRMLDYTDGDVVREAARTLEYVVQNTAGSDSPLAQELIQQVEKDAAAAGIDEEAQKKMKEASQQKAKMKEKEKAEEKLRRQAELDAQNARMRAMEDAFKQDHFERLIVDKQTQSDLKKLRTDLDECRDRSVKTSEAEKRSFQVTNELTKLQQTQQELQQTFHSATGSLGEELKSLQIRVAANTTLTEAWSAGAPQQEEAAKLSARLNAQVQWLESEMQTQLQTQQALQRSGESFDEKCRGQWSQAAEDRTHLRHGLERAQQDLENNADFLRRKLEEISTQAAVQCDSYERFANQKCEETQVSCNQALRSMQTKVDELHSECRSTELCASEFHKTAIEQIEQTMWGFEKRLFPYRQKPAGDHTSWATRVGGGFDIHEEFEERDPDTKGVRQSPPRPKNPTQNSRNSRGFPDEKEDFFVNGSAPGSHRAQEGEKPQEKKSAAGPAIAAARATRSSSTKRPQSARGVSRHREAAVNPQR